MSPPLSVHGKFIVRVQKSSCFSSDLRLFFGYLVLKDKATRKKHTKTMKISDFPIEKTQKVL